MVVNLGTTMVSPALLMEMPVPHFSPVLLHFVAGIIFANGYTWKQQTVQPNDSEEPRTGEEKPGSLDPGGSLLPDWGLCQRNR